MIYQTTPQLRTTLALTDSDALPAPLSPACIAETPRIGRWRSQGTHHHDAETPFRSTLWVCYLCGAAAAQLVLR